MDPGKYMDGKAITKTIPVRKGLTRPWLGCTEVETENGQKVPGKLEVSSSVIPMAWDKLKTKLPQTMFNFFWKTSLAGLIGKVSKVFHLPFYNQHCTNER